MALRSSQGHASGPTDPEVCITAAPLSAPVNKGSGGWHSQRLKAVRYLGGAMPSGAGAGGGAGHDDRRMISESPTPSFGTIPRRNTQYGIER